MFWTEPQNDEEKEHLIKKYQAQNKARGKARHKKKTKNEKLEWRHIAHNIREGAIKDRLELR